MSDICICGGLEFNHTVKSGWKTSQNGESVPCDFVTGKCSSCGIVKQLELPFSDEAEYLEYYAKEYPPVNPEYAIKDYQHDKTLADKRLKSYRIAKGRKLLDIGSGSGAFVDACRRKGVEAYGCEIGTYHYSNAREYTYPQQLQDVYFPTDHFDYIVCHDVVEHVLNPVKFVSEMFRILKQEGIGIIEIPNFYHPAGEYQWKAIEHIWYFTTNQFRKLLKGLGFHVFSIRNPVESKITFYVKKPIQNRPSILLPPGIGDSFWELVKLQAFLKHEGLGLPDIYIACRKDNTYNAHDRAFSFLDMVPFIHSTWGTKDISGKENRALWREAYFKKGQTIFENVGDCDYFFCHNGHIGKGVALDKVDTDLDCDWDIPFFVSLGQERFLKNSIKQFGKYIVFYFVFQGTYSYWIKEFPVQTIIESVQQIADETGCIPVFVGAPWDAVNPLSMHIREFVHCIDLIGQTTLEQAFGLIRGAEMVIGFPSGLTIMSAVLKQKTLIIWNDYYNKDFMWNACPPKTKRKTYFIENTRGLKPQSLTKTSMSILGDTPKKQRRAVVLKRKELDGPNDSIAVFCVLKSGGDYDLDYVLKLRNMLRRNSTIDYDFVCLTDIDIDPRDCKSIPLVREWAGWWSKIELFRPLLSTKKRIIYFDLDTVILGNIDDILQYDYSMSGLLPWNARNRAAGMMASGMMGWNNEGDFSFLFDQFKLENIKNYHGGDQHYISEILKNNAAEVVFFQNAFPGIYSFKRNCKRGLPEDARIVCFHGKPRLPNVNHTWVKENWL